MNERHLRIFLAVVTQGTMSAAARALYIAQPSVSAAIAELEAHYGIRLFERVGRRLILTLPGERLAGYARRYLACAEDMEQAMRSAAKAQRITLGATLTLGGCLMAPLVKAFEAAYPGVTVSVLVENTAAIEQHLLSGEVELALAEGEIRSPELMVQPLFPDELLLICAAGNALAQLPQLRLTDLEGLPFVMREPGSGTRRLFEQALAEKRVHIQERWTCANVQALFQAVKADCGAAVISRRLAALAGEGICARPFQDASLTRTFDLCYHKRRGLTPPLEAFIRLCRDAADRES